MSMRDWSQALDSASLQRMRARHSDCAVSDVVVIGQLGFLWTPERLFVRILASVASVRALPKAVRR